MKDKLPIHSSTSLASEDSVKQAIQAAYSSAQSTLVARLRSIDWADDAMQDAVLKALKVWPVDGIPEQAIPWLVTTGTNYFRDH